MAFLCILIGIILQRSLPHQLSPLRQFDWYDRYSQWMLAHLPGLTAQGLSSIIILLLPIILATGLLQSWMDDALFGLFSLAFGLIVFLFCLGPEDLDQQVDAYLQAHEDGDEELAHHYASLLIGEDAPRSPDQQIAEVMRGILHQANDRVFAVIFWFVLLGPVGALLFRLSSYTMGHSNPVLAEAAKKLQAVLAWAPAHLLAMAYALTGNYEGASDGFRNKTPQDDLSRCNYYTLVTAGLGALKDCGPGEETACIRSTRGLVLRSLVVWLAILAALTLIGWIA